MTAPAPMASARRLFSRTEIPMRICVDGFAIPVLNWSLGGLALAKPCPLTLSPGQRLAGSLELVVGGVNLSVKVALRLAHEQADRFGFTFVDLTPEQMGMLRALLVRGGASPLERAPIPADAANRRAPAGRRVSSRFKGNRRARRWLLRVAAAAVLMAATTAIAGYGLLQKSRVESAQAAVAVSTRIARISDRGYVDQIYVNPGQDIRAGEPLVSLRRRAEPSKSITLASPCDCTIVDVLVQPGNDIAADQPLVQLAGADAGGAFIEALVPASADVAVGQVVPVVVEGNAAVGSGRIVAIEQQRSSDDRFGLPPLLRRDPRFQLVIVSDLTGLGPLTPGQSARLDLSEARSWPERLAAEADRLAHQVNSLMGPVLGMAADKDAG
ncbi:MAG: hypothetical protein U1E66_12315 [Rhodospirillales bacterium]